MSVAYYNGEFCDFSSVRIPLSDRALFFGDGVYDAAIGNNGGIYLENEHIDRFFGNAKRLNIKLSLSKKELSELLKEVIKRNGMDRYFLYFQLSRTSPERNHAYPDESGSSLLITVKEHSLPDRAEKIKLITAEDIRYEMCNIKTLNLLPAVLASKKAEDFGCSEAVFIRKGIVTECAHSNIFIIRNAVVYTHPEGPHILPGVTRKRLLYLCERLGIEYREEKFTKEDLLSADEILVSSTTKLCVGARTVDGINVGSKNRQSSLAANAIINAIYEDFQG